jgi:hypothetical protein
MSDYVGTEEKKELQDLLDTLYEDEDTHYVCCQIPDSCKTFCGDEVESDSEIIWNEEDTTCAPCQLVMDMDPGYCPEGLKCPNG